MTSVEIAQADVDKAKAVLRESLPPLLQSTKAEWARYSSHAALRAVESQTRVTEEKTDVQLTEFKRVLRELDRTVISDIETGLRERLETQIDRPPVAYSQFEEPKDLISESFREYEQALWKRLIDADYREPTSVETFVATGPKTKYDRKFAEQVWSWISGVLTLMKASTALANVIASNKSASARERWERA